LEARVKTFLKAINLFHGFDILCSEEVTLNVIINPDKEDIFDLIILNLLDMVSPDFDVNYNYIQMGKIINCTMEKEILSDEAWNWKVCLLERCFLSVKAEGTCLLGLSFQS
jgi:hypothetical protein